RHRGETFRREEFNFDVLLARAFGKCRQCSHYSVDLRMPGVGCDKHAHQVTESILAGGPQLSCKSRRGASINVSSSPGCQRSPAALPIRILQYLRLQCFNRVTMTRVVS